MPLDDHAAAPDEGIDIEILPDGTVRVHALCRPGEARGACEERIRFLVEALGLPPDGVVTDVDPPPA